MTPEGGAAGPGWGWWPASRRQRRRERPGVAWRRRRVWGADGGGGGAFPMAAAVLGLLLLLLLLLGLGGSGAVLALAAGAGGAWAAAATLTSRDRKGAPAGASLANGGPATMRCQREQDEERRRQQRRGPYGDHLSPSAHFVVTPRRRYPIHQAQYTSLGTLPSICWDGYRRKTRLTLHRSSIIQSPVTVKIARPGSSLCRSPLLETPEAPLAFSSAPSSTVDPCAKETVLSALKENRKRAMLDGEEEEEEDQSFSRSQESKRRRHDSSGSGQSAFEPLVANGAPASLVPKPGSLKRSLTSSHCFEDCSAKRSRASSLSSVNSPSVGGIPSSFRNAIASSYSSTCGLSQLWKRKGPAASPLSSPESSRSQTPERPNKKSRFPSFSLADEASRQSGASTPTRTDKEAQAEKLAETPAQGRGRSLGSTSSGSSSAKRKRKIQLLASRRGDNFTLPPPPQLGYLVTSADLEAEKQATLQWFNKALEEKTDSAPGPAVQAASASSTFSFPTSSTKTTTASESIAAAGTNPLSEPLKMKDGQSGSTQADPGAAVDTPRPPTTTSASLDLGSPAPETSGEAAKPPTLVLNPLAALPGNAPPSSTPQPAGSPCITTASSSALGQTPVRPSTAPKPSVLFGILSSPPTSQSSAGTAAKTSAAPEAVPLFKPVFGASAKSESSPLPTSSLSEPSATAPASAAPSGLASSSTFQPIFGPLPPPAAATSSPFTFKQTLQQAAASALLTTSTAANTSAFPAASESTVTTPALLPTAASTPSAPTSKPAFSFGPAAPASTAGPGSSSTAAAVTAARVSQPSLFGIPSSASPATPSLFPFGNAAATTGPSASQAGPSSAAPAMPSTVPSIFSSTSTQVPPATTQPVLTFGPGPSAFSTGFDSASKPPPPYAAGSGQTALETSDGQQAGGKPAMAGAVSFGTPFGFPGSAAQPASQPTFGSATQTPFGGPGGPASFGAKSTSQPAFGSTTSMFSFATSTSSVSLGSGAGASLFGSPAPSPFAFGPASQPPAAGSTFGISVAPGAAAGAGSPATTFNFSSGQSGPAGTSAPFGSSLAQNQSPAFAFSIPGTSESKPAFGGAPAPTFGQSSPAPGGSSVGGSTLSFGMPVGPTFGGAGPTFGPSTPTFSIGAGSKTSRQRLQARRQHTRKK